MARSPAPPALDGVVVNRVATVAALTAALASPGLTHLVQVSTVLIYGPQPGGAVIEEDHPLQPEPGYPPAVEAAEVERRLLRLPPGVTATVLRAAIGRGDPLYGPMLRSWLTIRRAATERQLLGPGDLDAALAWAAAHRPVGRFHLAASPSPVPARRQLRLPPDAAGRVADRLHRMRLFPVDRHGLAYLAFPPVVSTDRLAAAGFSPSSQAG